jgi:hypothetical protein
VRSFSLEVFRESHRAHKAQAPLSMSICLAMMHTLSDTFVMNDFCDDVETRMLLESSASRRAEIGIEFTFADAGTPQMHPPRILDGVEDMEVSAFSDGEYYLLRRQEWFRLGLHVDASNGTIDFDDKPIMFHGTEWGSANKILMQSEGFITGGGTHRVRGRSLSGCWCVPTLGDALTRADPTRYVYNGGFSRLSCPVVLELRPAWLRRVPGSTMHCCTSQTGHQHEGLLIQAIHFNTRFMQNYMELERAAVVRELKLDSVRCRRCSCGLCGNVCSVRNDAQWMSWKRSGTGHWYDPVCYARITATSAAYI